MNEFVREINYYETDKMGITHHSNYVRFMEEARVHFLDAAGFGLKQLEAEGVSSPVVSIDCRYRQPTTFGDTVRIAVFVDSYNGARLALRYVMTNAATGAVVFTAASTHCFIDAAGKPLIVRRRFPALDAFLKQQASSET